MKILTAQEMRHVEALTDAAGTSYAQMMENAGSSVAQEITKRLTVQGRTILVLVGPGNNGGDGLVAARYLHDVHANVYVYLWRSRADDDNNMRLVRERGITVLQADADAGLAALADLAQRADIIIDALLGTGIARPIEGVMKAMLNTVRAIVSMRGENRPLIVAVDLPSGLNSDTGGIDPAALYADLTVTFAFPKRGLFLFPGAAYAGDVVVADIGIPRQLARDVALDLAEPDIVARLLPTRPRDAHKGTFGKLLVIAGCVNYTGAAYLACTAAYRVGAGLVTLAVARSIHPILAAKTTEVTFLPLPEAEPGYLSADSLPIVLDAVPRYDALLIGCGLGTHPQTRQIVLDLVGQMKKVSRLPMIIDADGLNALASVADWWSATPDSAVLTPHPGEMARLSGLSMEQIAADRIGITMQHATAWAKVVLLKGAYTVIAAPSGVATINPFANPALATAGTGDVLAGTIAGLLTQGVPPYAAAVAGAYLHASAAQIVTENIGDAGMVASDLLPALPHAIRRLRRGEE